MQELRLVAVSEDGTYAVLAVPGRGGRFVLPIDDRLRTVARGQFSRLAQYEIEVENPLRPKEIQDRIRAGETAEEIADAAGIPIDRVRRFEGPVLAEREYRAQEAQRSTVRGHTESGPGPRLGEIVAERLTDAGAPADSLAWDSRKRTDGNWQVQLQFTLEHRPQLAEWVFDPRRRHVIPADDLARRLCLPQVDWPAGRLGALGAPTATVTPIGSRLGGHHADSRADPRAEPDRAMARGAQAAPAATPTHAPWSREAREPAWARETPPGPAARPPEADRAATAAPAEQSAGAGYASMTNQAGLTNQASDTNQTGSTNQPGGAASQSGTGQAEDAPRAELRAAELRVAELRAAETVRAAAEARADDAGRAGRTAASTADPGAAAAASADAAAGTGPRAADSPRGGDAPGLAAGSETARLAESAEGETGPRPGRKAGRNRRASVPSWDEIMLGNSRPPD
jgi:hypothetical protein